MNNNIINQIAMTIFPELANPPQRVMGIFPYLSDTHVKTRVVEFISYDFEDYMGNNFHENRLRRFLNDNRNNINDMVNELMTEYDDYQPNEVVNPEIVERLLRNGMIYVYDAFIDIQAWNDAQARP